MSELKLRGFCAACILIAIVATVRGATFQELVTEGNAQYKANDLARALRTSREAMELDSKRFEGHALAALVLLKQGHVDEAMKHADMALSLGPNDRKKALTELKESVATAKSQVTARTDELSPEHTRRFASLKLILDDAENAKSTDERSKYLREFLAKSEAFANQHTNYLQVWFLRAAVALQLEDRKVALSAGKEMARLGADSAGDEKVRMLMAKLDRKGWLQEQTGPHQAFLSDFEQLVGANYVMASKQFQQNRFSISKTVLSASLEGRQLNYTTQTKFGKPDLTSEVSEQQIEIFLDKLRPESFIVTNYVENAQNRFEPGVWVVSATNPFEPCTRITTQKGGVTTYKVVEVFAADRNAAERIAASLREICASVKYTGLSESEYYRKFAGTWSPNLTNEVTFGELIITADTDGTRRLTGKVNTGLQLTDDDHKRIVNNSWEIIIPETVIPNQNPAQIAVRASGSLSAVGKRKPVKKNSETGFLVFGNEKNASLVIKETGAGFSDTNTLCVVSLTRQN